MTATPRTLGAAAFGPASLLFARLRQALRGPAALVGGSAPIVDPTGGLADLAARRLRACRASAFSEDPVRVIRLLRLAHALGFQVEPETERLARAAAQAISTVAAERVRDELTAL